MLRCFLQGVWKSLSLLTLCAFQNRAYRSKYQQWLLDVRNKSLLSKWNALFMQVCGHQDLEGFKRHLKRSSFSYLRSLICQREVSDSSFCILQVCSGPHLLHLYTHIPELSSCSAHSSSLETTFAWSPSYSAIPMPNYLLPYATYLNSSFCQVNYNCE